MVGGLGLLIFHSLQRHRSLLAEESMQEDKTKHRVRPKKPSKGQKSTSKSSSATPSSSGSTPGNIKVDPYKGDNFSNDTIPERRNIKGRDSDPDGFDDIGHSRRGLMAQNDPV